MRNLTKALLGAFLVTFIIWVVSIITAPLYLAESEGGCGTGFYVNSQGYMVTAAHVIGKDRGGACYADGSKCGRTVSIDYRRDIAYLKFDGPTPYLTFNILPKNKEVFIHFYGYPTGPNPSILKHGTGLAVVKGGLFGENTYYSRANIKPGNSGGPALFEGNVVGSITHRIISGPAGNGWGATSEDMIDLANDSGVKTYQNQQPKSVNTEAVIFICTKM